MNALDEIQVESAKEDQEQLRRARSEHHRRDCDPDDPHSPDYTMPIPYPAYIDLYPDGTYQGPTYIFTPLGWNSGQLQVQMFRAALSSSSGPGAFDFYSNGMTQYLYIPFAQKTTASPNSSPQTVSEIIQTSGVASNGPPPTLSAVLYYPTFTVWPNPTAFPTLGIRVTSFLPGSSNTPSEYVPAAAVVDYRNNGAEVVLRLNNIPGQSSPVSYVWRKIAVGYASPPQCPGGYAEGNEDLFLQYTS